MAVRLLAFSASFAQSASRRILERPFPAETALVANGKANVLIIHGRETAAEAEALSRQLGALGRADFPLMLDTEATGGKLWTLRADVRQRNLLVIGNINNNRAVLALYAQFLAAANGRFPGPGRYVIRHLAEPFSPCRTAILVGASDAKGLAAGLARFVDLLKEKTTAEHSALPLPFLEFGDAAGTTRIPRGNHKFHDLQDAAYVFYTNGMPPSRYAWNAIRSPDAAWAAAREMLLKVIAREKGDYPIGGHYQFIYGYQALRIALAHGILTGTELRALEEKLLTTALDSRDDYVKRWVAQIKKPDPDGTFGCEDVGRHALSALVGHWLLLDYLVRFTPVAEPYASELNAVYRGFTRVMQNWDRNRRLPFARDPAGSLDCANMMLYAFMQAGIEDFVTNGTLRDMAHYYLTNVNSLWTDAGIGSYISAYNGSHLQSLAGGLAVRALAFFTGDRSLEWLQTQQFEESGTYRRGFNDRAHMCLDQPEPFALPAGADSGPPNHLAGFMTCPVDPYLWRTLYQRDQAVDPAGVTREKTYDALVFRDGWEPDAAFLNLKGIQGMSDDTALELHAVGTYTELGGQFLFGNSFLLAKWQRSGVSVDSGRPAKEGELATLEASMAGPALALATSRVREHNGTVWDRTIVRKAKSWFLVLDDLTAREEGDYLFTAAWRILPPGATNEAGVFQATAPNGTQFTLQPGRPYRQELTRPSLDGASRPTFLRQHQRARLAPGAAVRFHNLLKAENDARRVPCEIRSVADGRAVVVQDLSPAADHAVAGTGPLPPLPNLPAGEVAGYCLTAGTWALGGATRLVLDAHAVLTADRPVSLLFDFGRKELRVDVPAGAPAVLDLAAPLLAEPKTGLRLEPGSHALPLALAPAPDFARQVLALPPFEPAQSGLGAPSAARAIPGLAQLWVQSVQDPPARVLHPIRIRSTPQPYRRPDESLHDDFFGTTSVPGGSSWKGEKVEFDIDAGETARIVTGLRICGGSREFELEESADGRQFRPLQFRSDKEAVYVGYSRMRVGSDRFGTRHLSFRSGSRYLKLRCRGAADASMDVKEIQVLAEPAPDEVWGRLLVERLAANRPPLVLCRTGQRLDNAERAGFVTALGLNGSVLWRHEDTGPAQYRATYWLTGDADGDGNSELLVYSDANVLTVYRHDGQVLRTVDIAAWETARKPGWTYDSHAGGKSIALWPRAADGTAYAYVFGHVHHYRVKLFPQTEIVYRKSSPNRSCAPSAAVPVRDWSGANKQNLISLVPYDHIVALWEDGGPGKPPRMVVERRREYPKPSGNTQLPAFVEGCVSAKPAGIVVATPNVVRFFAGHTLEPAWSVPGSVPFSALALADPDANGTDEVLAGQANGRVSLYDLASGEKRAQTVLQGEVRALFPAGRGRLLAATHAGLTLLDARLRTLGHLPCPLEDATVLADDARGTLVFVLGRDGVLRGYALQG
ncbi:MAG: hypothetical protein JXR37_09470 [Kiritimatiellae bacterium]|nr:hypothetical protein [Kiritimatiellia bacterium]